MTEKSGLGRTGWQTGVCVGDYDNDGWDDLFCTFWGHNILFHNNGDGTFTDVTQKAGLYQEKGRWGTGCTFLDYDRDGHLDLFVCNFIKLDPDKIPTSSRQTSFCQWKGIPTMCGPRGLPGGHEHPLPQQRRRHVYRRFGEGRHPEARPALLHHGRLLRLRQRRLARHLCRGRLRAQHSVQEQPRRHVHRCRRHGRLRLQRRWPRAGRHGHRRGRLRLRWLARHLQNQLRRRHLRPLPQQRRRHLQRCHPSAPASASTTSTSPGAAALSITTTTAGPTSFRSTATSIPKSTTTTSARPSRIRASSIRTLATATSKMSLPKWVPASARAFPAAARPLATTTTTAAWTFSSST